MASDSPSGLAGFGEEDIFCEPSLMNLVEQDSLKWIFVGGKGGVGKTTVSCSLGVQLAQRGKKVLIVSTDPAHNLSDAFAQKFSTEPTPVHGLSRLACMEMDPSEVQANASAASNPQATALQSALGGSGLAEGMMQMPGIDELMGLGALVRTLSSYDYDVIVFDTAPTGHTLRLLSLPSTALRLLDKLSGSGGLLSMAMNMLGGGAGGQGGMGGMLDSLRATFTSVQEQFTNPDLTTFVPVCIPEFLSVFETERLVQELTDLGIDLHNIVVNQVLFPEGGPGDHADCQLCCARNRMQDKYLAQVDVLYGEDFHIVHMPIVTAEVRGLARLLAYSAFLMDPYTPSKHGYVTEAGFGGGVFVKPPRAGAVLPAPAPGAEGGAAPGAGPDSLADDDLDAALADILG